MTISSSFLTFRPQRHPETSTTKTQRLVKNNNNTITNKPILKDQVDILPSDPEIKPTLKPIDDDPTQRKIMKPSLFSRVSARLSIRHQHRPKPPNPSSPPNHDLTSPLDSPPIRTTLKSDDQPVDSKDQSNESPDPTSTTTSTTPSLYTTLPALTPTFKLSQRNQSRENQDLGGTKNSLDRNRCGLNSITDSIKDEPKSSIDTIAPPSSSSRPPSRASLFFWKRISQSSYADGNTLSLIDPGSVENQIDQGSKSKAKRRLSTITTHQSDLSTRAHDQEMIHTSVSSEGHLSSVMSSEDMSETLSSTIDTNETSVCLVEELDDSHDQDQEDCGLAGIGIRDRNSISLFSLPLRNSCHPYLQTDPTKSPSSTSLHGSGLMMNHKPIIIHHPGMRYAPSNSSPLSSRPQSPADLTYPVMSTTPPNPNYLGTSSSSHSHLTIRTHSDTYRKTCTTPSPSNLNPNTCTGTTFSPSTSTSSSPSSKHHRPTRHLDPQRPVSYGQLNIIPNQHSCVASHDLIKLLRGPSSYPAETLPRCDRRNSYVCA